jgi:predicted phosphoribosyltransferase
LAAVLRDNVHPDGDLIVLALPRGGVPVGAEVAISLDAPLDVFVVRKLGVPGHEELAMGAIASGGTVVVNPRVVSSLAIPDTTIDAVVDAEAREVERRERAYRGERAPLDVTDRTVVLVDDGLATGSTMRAAIEAIHALGPRKVIVAVPVASRQTVEELRPLVDDIVVVATPSHFYAVGQAYDDFSQTSDAEVRALLSPS